VLAATAAVLLLAGCSGGADDPASPPAATSTPLAAYDTEDLVLSPTGPCASVTPAQVTDALGSEVEASRTWAPGQRLPGTREVADEYGCRHTAGDVTASAWVFAAPTPRPVARRLVREVTRGDCRADRDAGSFGDPGVAYACDLDSGATLTGVRGLVDRTWVACEIRGTDDAERVGRWCVSVLESLSAS
jgi:hypothetical protein